MMLVQSYNDGTTHIFNSGSTFALASFDVTPPLTRRVEERLKFFRLHRKGKWKDHEWGSEARFYFRKADHRVNYHIKEMMRETLRETVERVVGTNSGLLAQLKGTQP